MKHRWHCAEECISNDSISNREYINYFFQNQTVVTKDEVNTFEWERSGLEGYFADIKSFEKKASLLDMIVEL
jgi:hypothetical protein